MNCGKLPHDEFILSWNDLSADFGFTKNLKSKASQFNLTFEVRAHIQ